MATGALRASDVAYEQLRTRILDLRLPPGSVVNEHAIAAELGMSRMPVHEAVARLAADRFIAVLPGRQSVVTAFDLQDVLGMFDAREAIEGGAARIAAERATARDLDRMRRLVQVADQARRGSDRERLLREDHEIHSFLVHTIRNALLQDAADRLLLHNWRTWRSYSSWRTAHDPGVMSHSPLLTALEARDGEGAERAMRAHIGDSRRLLLSSMEGATTAVGTATATAP